MAELSKEFLKKCLAEFQANPKHEVALNAVTQSGLKDACLRRLVVQKVNHHYSHRVADSKPITDQKSSGRCWLFAATNAMRAKFMPAHSLEKFEFSQQYLFFWDKMERSNYFLETIIETRSEPLNGRVVSFLLANPVDDGGQWDMMTAMVLKYGVVPRDVYTDAHASTASRSFDWLLAHKLREFAKKLRDLSADGKDVAALRAVKEAEMLPAIYRICCISLGTPPSAFDWEYTDKDKKYHVVKDLTPLTFYETLVKPHFNLEDKICLVHDPRPENPFGHTYTVQYLGNVVGGKPVTYVNLKVDDIKKAAFQSISEGSEPVWFGCDVGQHFDVKLGVLDLQLRNIEGTFDTSVSLMTKADRIQLGESIPGHAMLFTAVNCQDDGKMTKWRVENSWGDERSDKGFLLMTDGWFTEFVFNAVIDKKYLSPEVLEIYKQPPRVLPPWDPMGTLA